jgi:hypothetical protein
MSKQLREHQARKTALVKEARALTDLVASQDRDMTDDEVTAFEALRTRIDSASTAIDREAALIADESRIGLAEVALGIHMQANRLQHGVGQLAAQKWHQGVLMHVIAVGLDLHRCATFRPEHMAHVVQQAGDDHLVRLACRLRQVGTLQRVFKLTDGFAAILFGAMIAQQSNNVFGSQCHVVPELKVL